MLRIQEIQIHRAQLEVTHKHQEESRTPPCPQTNSGMPLGEGQQQRHRAPRQALTAATHTHPTAATMPTVLFHCFMTAKIPNQCKIQVYRFMGFQVKTMGSSQSGGGQPPPDPPLLPAQPGFQKPQQPHPILSFCHENSLISPVLQILEFLEHTGTCHLKIPQNTPVGSHQIRKESNIEVK